MPARISSTAPAGARYRSTSRYSGAGRARVSSLPLGVSGNAASTTTAAGTIYIGSRSASAARTPAGSAVPVTYPTSRLSPGRSSRAITTACSTPSSPANAACTSPSSMRYPRILTCSSARPTYRNCPSAPHHTKSPVRYIRIPGAPAPRTDTPQTATRSNPARPRYPTPTPRPATYNSPTTPAGTGRNHPSSTNNAAPDTGAPIGAAPEPRCQRRTHRRVHRRLGRDRRH